jgi:Na+-transporting methylmalonyl-CoA/oxaloacetate decarboxylase gamma subunit
MNLEQVYVSAVSFCAVFVMLSILAGLMSLLTRLFPGEVVEKKRSPRAPGDGPDQELIAAVLAAVTIAAPGARVTKIEEMK